MMNIEGGGGVKEEIRAADESSSSQEDGKDNHEIHDFDVVAVDDNNRRSSVEHHDSLLSSLIEKDQDNQLECAKAKVGEVREENERLRLHLDRITKEYKTLEMKFHDIVQQESHKHNNHNNIIYDEENQLVSLSLGRVARKDEKITKVSESCWNKQSLSLGLESNFLQTASNKSVVSETSNSFEEVKDEAGETCMPLASKRSGDDEVSQQTPIAKKARVSVRARCDTPTMNDGCQWRKYGQKISKGNPCPRAYYRCTVAPNCPVRKQVQRCAQDMSILITTYEGNHNHPLSISATAMASTTSAAASMLLSGSSSTSSHFYSSSSTNSFPTITIDLTSSNPNPSRPSYPPTTLNFTSSQYGSSIMAQQPNFGTINRYQQLIKSHSSSNPIPSLAAATKAITTDPTFQSALAAALTSVIGNQVGGEQRFKWGEAATNSNNSVGCVLINNSTSILNSHPPGGFMFLPSSLPFSTPNSTSTSPSETRE